VDQPVALVHFMKWSLVMFDINNIQDKEKFIVTLYQRLTKCKEELLEKTNRVEFYPTTSDAMDRRELDAISSIVSYFDNYRD